eukprot:CAMPEP_0206053442 /NCGR_PEP_ID=MMETSP1466-20131121/35828_1 /ASSEMBLY_ACC=CAM_ASM_001126 /TAXON_ID=44452 /ORGANISM="Pavlova gyrans, Strain CCMP608" /LENGTH=269 /DNA_ID=CAMNT_0053428615 /DNA_START=68 /DNA_END=877 /DNA_ORIENTATION=+
MAVPAQRSACGASAPGDCVEAAVVEAAQHSPHSSLAGSQLPLLVYTAVDIPSRGGSRGFSRLGTLYLASLCSPPFRRSRSLYQGCFLFVLPAALSIEHLLGNVPAESLVIEDAEHGDAVAYELREGQWCPKDGHRDQYVHPVLHLSTDAVGHGAGLLEDHEGRDVEGGCEASVRYEVPWDAQHHDVRVTEFEGHERDEQGDERYRGLVVYACDRIELDIRALEQALGEHKACRFNNKAHQSNEEAVEDEIDLAVRRYRDASTNPDHYAK